MFKLTALINAMERTGPEAAEAGSSNDQIYFFTHFHSTQVFMVPEVQWTVTDLHTVYKNRLSLHS